MERSGTYTRSGIRFSTRLESWSNTWEPYVDVTERRHAEHRLLVQHRVTRILAEAATRRGSHTKNPRDDGRVAGMGSRCSVAKRSACRRAPLRRAVADTLPRGRAVRGCHSDEHLLAGSGLPGRVWASGAPAYIPDVIRDPEFDRADIAAREGLHGACAFPILLGGEVLGVIGFFSRDVWQADQNLLDMMATIGSQIGEFTKRAAAVDELHLRVNMLQQIPVASLVGKTRWDPRHRESALVRVHRPDTGVRQFTPRGVDGHCSP